MADKQNEDIQNFCSITGAEPQAARHFLEASGWNLEIATAQFYENQEPMAEGNLMDEDEDEDDADLYASGRAPQASSSAPAPTAQHKSQSKGSGAKIRTLGDLGGSRDSEEDEDDDTKRRDLFAGGEKSGLAVQDPANPSGAGHGNLIQNILRRAAETGRRGHDDEEPVSETRFSGAGHTLGSDATDSVTIPSPHASAPAHPPSVTRTLTFWRDGFSIEDGPLMRYDDPNNREVLQAIENGRAPLSLMRVEPGQAADVNVFKRLDEDYVPPKKKFVPFSGQGQRLGSITPGESIQPPAVAAAPAAKTAASSSQPTPNINVDSSAPVTSIQIRLGDGTRLVSRFNHTHTVGDVYGFVDAASPDSRSRPYILQTTFPNKELKDRGQTLKEAGLINAVVVQKWSS